MYQFRQIALMVGAAAGILLSIFFPVAAYVWGLFAGCCIAALLPRRSNPSVPRNPSNPIEFRRAARPGEVWVPRRGWTADVSDGLGTYAVAIPDPDLMAGFEATLGWLTGEHAADRMPSDVFALCVENLERVKWCAEHPAIVGFKPKPKPRPRKSEWDSRLDNAQMLAALKKYRTQKAALPPGQDRASLMAQIRTLERRLDESTRCSLCERVNTFGGSKPYYIKSDQCRHL